MYNYMISLAGREGAPGAEVGMAPLGKHVQNSARDGAGASL